MSSFSSAYALLRDRVDIVKKSGMSGVDGIEGVDGEDDSRELGVEYGMFSVSSASRMDARDSG